MEWIVETKGLTKRLGAKTAVDQVDLRIGKGEIYGFLGPNGAGKTTTIRMLLGLMRPTSGDIRVFGMGLKKDKLAILKRIGSLVENPSYYGHLTAYENLEAVRRILDAPKRRIDEALKTVRLDKEAHRPVKGFSLGMKQRLGIATALLGEPELLVLDEPTNGLDPAGILEIRELIRSMPKEYGMTVLVSSHLLSEIDQTATQVGIISGGRLIFQDSILALRRRSQSSIRMTVDDPARALEALSEPNFGAERTETGISFRLTSNEAVAAAVERLVAAEVSVYRVEESKTSLEDIFLELTGTGASL
ncbi:ABC transporter ATP-binding protein [Paenibacillus antri]|uniref:ABC transporter ATP-binding protein n=1 Tax=Paenibacillus antri TaxID=2582848 RepID=A0A5R9G1P8_9BACL|nr:ABC transporter ATP-binding protein [Paenibacillus antri]TLS49731.1 ABC transporter ATP-binding protein [Paenibacillus antri]